jgi:small conductance mechanosensitive channel
MEEDYLNDIGDQLGEYYQTIVTVAPRLLVAIVILLVFWFIGYYVKVFSTKRLQKKMTDSLLANFLAGVIRTVIVVMGLLFVFRFWGLTGVVSGVLAGAGITAFVIGFALKDIGENFLAGVLLAFKRPFRTGDVIEVSGMRGRVVTLNLRDTQIKTYDGKDVYMPNGMIVKNPLINFTIDGFLRHEFEVKIPKGKDYDEALGIIEKSMKEVEGVLEGFRKTSIEVKESSSAGITIQIFFWVDTFARKIPATKVKTNAILAVQKALEAKEYF